MILKKRMERSEMKEVIRKLIVGKAPDIKNIMAEMLKYGEVVLE